MKNPDVLIVCTHFGENTAAYRRLSYFAKYLRSRGLRVSCIGFLGISSSGIVKPSRGCYGLPFFISTRHIWGLILNAIFSLFVIVVILISRPRMVILSIPDASLVVATYLGCLLIGSKLIIDIRDPQEEIIAHKYKQGLSSLIAKIFRQINYSIYRRADVVTGVTRTLVTMLANATSKFIHLVPNGADLKIFVPINKGEARETLGLSQDSFLIAYVGGLVAYEQYDVLPILTAIKRAKESSDINVRLTAAGPISNENDRRIIEKFKDVVSYMGVLDTKGVLTLLSACDVGVIPRVGDPIYDYALPVKFYEYIAMGLPVIAITNRKSELAKIVEDNKLGLVCKPGDQLCLENAIMTLATDKSLLGELKRNVFAFRKNIDRSIGAERLYGLINKLLQT